MLKIQNSGRYYPREEKGKNRSPKILSVTDRKNLY